MNDLLYKRKLTSHIDWPNLVFYAAGEGEAFQEMRVITLTSHFLDVCQERALETVEYRSGGEGSLWMADVQEEAFRIIQEDNVTVQEVVRVDNDMSVTVILDVKEITDEDITMALLYLEQSNIPGETFFGKPKTFTLPEVQEVICCANSTHG